MCARIATNNVLNATSPYGVGDWRYESTGGDCFKYILSCNYSISTDQKQTGYGITVSKLSN